MFVSSVSFKGMPNERAYTIEFLGTERPKAVSVNGQKVTNGVWNYNSLTNAVTVYVPATDCTKEIVVKLEN